MLTAPQRGVVGQLSFPRHVLMDFGLETGVACWLSPGCLFRPSVHRVSFFPVRVMLPMYAHIFRVQYRPAPPLGVTIRGVVLSPGARTQDCSLLVDA